MKRILILALIALTLLMPVSALNTKLSSTDYDPSPAQPGKYVTLFLKVENPGSETLKDQSFKLIPKYPFSLRPGEAAIHKVSTMTGGDVVSLEYDLFVDENVLAGKYPLTLKFCGDATCSSGYEQDIDITVRTGGTPKIEIGVEDSDVFTAGMTGEVTLHVINKGLLGIKFLVIELKDTPEYDILTPARIYIGELQSDDFETATFKLHVDESIITTKKLELPVLVEYSDENDKEYNQETTTYVTTYSGEDLARFKLSPKTGFAKYIAILIGIGAVYFFYRHYKKKRMKK